LRKRICDGLCAEAEGRPFRVSGERGRLDRRRWRPADGSFGPLLTPFPFVQKKGRERGKDVGHGSLPAGHRELLVNALRDEVLSRQFSICSQVLEDLAARLAILSVYLRVLRAIILETRPESITHPEVTPI